MGCVLQPAARAEGQFLNISAQLRFRRSYGFVRAALRAWISAPPLVKIPPQLWVCAAASRAALPRFRYS